MTRWAFMFAEYANVSAFTSFWFPILFQVSSTLQEVYKQLSLHSFFPSEGCHHHVAAIFAAGSKNMQAYQKTKRDGPLWAGVLRGNNVFTRLLVVKQLSLHSFFPSEGCHHHVAAIFTLQLATPTIAKVTPLPEAR